MKAILPAAWKSFGRGCTLGVVTVAMSLMPASVARADEAQLQQTQEETKAAAQKLAEAERQLKDVEAKRAETLRKLEDARKQLELAEQEANTAREKLKNANSVLQNIEEERTHAAKQLVDASISTTAEPSEADGKAYPVTGIIIEYAQDHPAHLAPEELLDQKVEILRTLNGFVAPRPGDVNSRIRLMDIPDLSENRFYGSALRRICAALVQRFNEENLIGVYISPDPSQIDLRTGEDFRPAGQTTLKVIVRTAIVAEVRTVAAGDRLDPSQRINNPAHSRALRFMPLQTATPGDFGSGALIRKDALSDYVHRLNRHPARRVDVALSSAGEDTPGGTAVDLMIAETKPWTVYYQLSNTGTEATSTWRHRFGFVHNQLTDNDDVLSVDYITGGFDEVHSVVASYEAPWFDSDSVRWRVHGLWSIFHATDLGLADVNFSGEEESFGGQIIANVWQRDEAFIDVYGGAEFRYIETENDLIGDASNSTNLFVPHVGARYEKYTDKTATNADVRLRFNLPSIANSDQGFDGNGVGTIDSEEEYIILSWSASHSFYIDPWFNKEIWADEARARERVLAHEIYLAFRGQTSFGDRLIAQEQQTVGGLYTVRGYDESDSVGDTAFYGTAEYRYHVPRAFAVEPEPGTLFGKPFKWAPQYPLGRPDWDLVLKGFVDVGRTYTHGEQNWEDYETLVGTGIGVDVLYKRNVSLRADWGVALTETEETGPGHNVLHLVLTLLY